MNARLQKACCQVVRYFSTACNQHVSHPAGHQAKFSEEIHGIISSCNNRYGIILPEYKITAGDGHLILSCHGADQHILVVFISYIDNLLSIQRGVCGNSEMQQFYHTMGKTVNLNGRWELEDACHFICSSPFRIDDHGKTEFLL